MSLTELPIACTLTDLELQERRSTLLHQVGQDIQEVVEREQGFAYRFPAERLPELAHIIGLERQCCAFLRFTLTIEPGNGPLWLEVTGPEGTKDFLITFWNEAQPPEHPTKPTKPGTLRNLSHGT